MTSTSCDGLDCPAILDDEKVRCSKGSSLQGFSYGSSSTSVAWIARLVASLESVVLPSVPVLSVVLSMAWPAVTRRRGRASGRGSLLGNLTSPGYAVLFCRGSDPVVSDGGSGDGWDFEALDWDPDKLTSISSK